MLDFQSEKECILQNVKENVKETFLFSYYDKVDIDRLCHFSLCVEHTQSECK